MNAEYKSGYWHIQKGINIDDNGVDGYLLTPCLVQVRIGSTCLNKVETAKH